MHPNAAQRPRSSRLGAHFWGPSVPERRQLSKSQMKQRRAKASPKCRPKSSLFQDMIFDAKRVAAQSKLVFSYSFFGISYQPKGKTHIANTFSTRCGNVREHDAKRVPKGDINHTFSNLLTNRLLLTADVSIY